MAACILLQVATVDVPFLPTLRTAPLTPADWGVVLGGALVPVAVVEGVKLARGSRGGAAPVGRS